MSRPLVRPEEVEIAPYERGPAAEGPHVAVLVSLDFPGITAPVADLVRRFTRCALRTLVDLGASYELMDTSVPLARPGRAAELDGVLVLGGGDVSATLWGGTDDPRITYGVDRRADEDTIAALLGAAEADRPVLAICRGAQLLNVAYGGTILPDISDYALHHGPPGQPLFLDEPVTVAPGSRVHRALGTSRVTVRSGHHQAVDRVGEELVVTALADDGIIEAVEHPRRPLVGVQWHPEDDEGSCVDRHRLFSAFLAGWPPDPGTTPPTDLLQTVPPTEAP
jgi:putative glutamine amidotransferase